MDKGVEFVIESDKIALLSDIPAWCHFTGNQLLKTEMKNNPPSHPLLKGGKGGLSGETYRFYVKKMSEKGKVTVIGEY